MLDNIIYLYEYIKGLLQYINADADSDELDDQAIENTILDIEKEYCLRRVDKLKSKEEIEKYLKQASDGWNSKQLSRIKIGHGYSKSDVVDGNNNLCNNIIHAPAVKVEPRSEIYGLREIKKIKEESRICCNSPQLYEHPVKR